MSGPKSIIPKKIASKFPFNPDQYYPSGHQCEYAKLRKNLRNRGSIVLGDPRTWDDTTVMAEFFKSKASDKPASQMMTHLESLPRDQLDATYKKAEKLIGRAVVDGWET